MSIIFRIWNYIKRERNSIAYWKKKGAIIGEDCIINSSAEFGTEAYLIKIGKPQIK